MQPIVLTFKNFAYALFENSIEICSNNLEFLYGNKKFEQQICRNKFQTQTTIAKSFI